MNERPRPTHAPITAFPVVDGCLHIGGIPLTRLAERVGGTPFYAYDRALIRGRVADLRRHLPEGVELSYAIKANPMAAIVGDLADRVDRFDVASAGEMKTALDTTVDPARISFAGPGKTRAELAQAVAAGIEIHLESEAEMETVAALGESLGIRPTVGLRINPDFQLKGSGMRMGGGAQQFGIDAERIPQVMSRLADLDLQFEGFHIFAGSQNLRADLVHETQEKTIDLAVSLAAHTRAPIRLLNIGGGFGIPYFPGDKPLDLAAVGAGLGKLMPRVAGGLPEATVVVELGRYIVGEAGIYVCRVVDRKESRGRVFLVTNGGLNHHLAASGNFGQVIRRNYPVAVGNKMDSQDRETVSVVGNLCTPLDLLGDQMDLAKAEVGDLIVIFQSGAYGLTASPTAFLGHPPPAEVLV